MNSPSHSFLRSPSPSYPHINISFIHEISLEYTLYALSYTYSTNAHRILLACSLALSLSHGGSVKNENRYKRKETADSLIKLNRWRIISFFSSSSSSSFFSIYTHMMIFQKKNENILKAAVNKYKYKILIDKFSYK